MYTIFGITIDKMIPKIFNELNIDISQLHANSIQTRIDDMHKVPLDSIEIYQLITGHESKVINLLINNSYDINILIDQGIEYIFKTKILKGKVNIFSPQINIEKLKNYAKKKTNLHKQKEFSFEKVLENVNEINLMLHFSTLEEIQASKGLSFIPLRDEKSFTTLLKNTSKYLYCKVKDKEMIIGKKYSIIPTITFDSLAFNNNKKSNNNFRKVMSKAKANLYTTVPLQFPCLPNKNVFHLIIEIYMTAFSFLKFVKEVKNFLSGFPNNKESLTEDTQLKCSIFKNFGEKKLSIYLVILFSKYLDTNYKDMRSLIVQLLGYEKRGSAATLNQSEIDKHEKYLSGIKLIISFLNQFDENVESTSE